MCSNKADLKWCRNTSAPELSEADWKPFVDFSKCTFANKTNSPNGQWVHNYKVNDGIYFNCFNRMDENPFVRAYSQKTWLNISNTKCPYSWGMRCIGFSSDRCVPGPNTDKSKS